MDTFRIVTIGQSGRPMPQMDLAVSQGDLWWLRGTFKHGARSPGGVVPAPSRPRQTDRSRGRTDAASTVSATWRVKGATADEAIDRLDRFLTQSDSGRDHRYFEWRPDGASASAYLRILGPGSYTPNYEWVQFVGSSDGAAINVDVTWPVDPVSHGAPWDVSEEFEVPPFDPVGASNLAINPRAALDLRGGYIAGASLGTLTRDTTWPTNATSFRVAGTCSGLSQLPGLALMSTSMTMPVVVGADQSYSLDYKIVDRPGTATVLVTLLRGYTASGSVSVFGSTNTTISADNQTGTVAVEGLTIPAGVTHMGFYFYMGNTGATDTFDLKFTNLMFVPSATLPSGGFADGDSDTWGWEGQAHYSVSQELLEDKFAEWTVDLATGLAAVRGPHELVFENPGTSGFRARHTGRNTGPRVNDEVEVDYSISTTAQTYCTLSNNEDGNAYLAAGVDSGGTLRIWVQYAAGRAAVGSTAAVSPTVGSLHTLRFSREGVTCTATLFAQDGSTSLGAAVATLSGQDENAFQGGGDAGLLVEGTNLSVTRIHAWRRRPLTWRLSTSYTLPDTFVVPDLPGSIDGPSHLVDVAIQPLTQTDPFAFGLLAWTGRTDLENYVWNGDFEIDSVGWAAGGGGPDGSPVVAGVSTGTSVSRSVGGGAKFGRAQLVVIGNGVLGSQAGSFKMYRRFRQGQVYTAVAWASLVSAFLGTPTISSTAIFAGPALAPGTFYYKVAALNAAGESLPSVEEFETVFAGPVFIRITWAAIAGATGYRIYRSNTGAGNEDESQDVAAVTTFDDTGSGWVADTPLTVATATITTPTSQIALGYDSSDRTLLSVGTLTSTMLRYSVEWTPTADRDMASFALLENAIGEAVTAAIDGVCVFEGRIPPKNPEALYGRGAARPFGKLAARSDYRSARVGTWSTAGTDHLVSATLSGGGGTISLDYLVDPFLLLPPDDERDPVVEVYAHGTLTAALVLGARFRTSVAAVDVGAARQYAQPSGSAGRPITDATSTAIRTWRLGQLALDRDLAARGRLAIRIELVWTSASGSPTFDLGYLLLVPIDGVASSPTGKANDSAYPVIVPAAGTEPNIRVVKSNLTGLLLGATSGRGTSDSSMGGEPIELPSGGDALLLTYLTLGVPDDPTADAHADTDAAGVVVHASITPRHNLVPPAR